MAADGGSDVVDLDFSVQMREAFLDKICNGPRIVAALSVSMPLSQMTDERVGLIKRCFLETKPLIDSYFQLFKLEEGHDLLG